MANPIRMLHFADLHVGMENYGKIDPLTGTSSRVRDFLDRLDELIEHALQHEADLAVFAGDAFKSRDPNPTQQREFAQRIKRLADAMPTLLLVGNHDMPGMPSKASSVDIFQALDVPGAIDESRPREWEQTRRQGGRNAPGQGLPGLDTLSDAKSHALERGASGQVDRRT